MERNVFERKRILSKTKVVCTTKHAFALRLSPNAYYDTLMHMYEWSQNSSDNLPAPTPHPAPHHWPVLFHSAAGQRSRLWGKHGDRYLITVLVDQKIKIPEWYCLEDEAVTLFDSCFTFESKLGFHRLFLTVESTKGTRTQAVVF